MKTYNNYQNKNKLIYKKNQKMSILLKFKWMIFKKRSQIILKI